MSALQDRCEWAQTLMKRQSIDWLFVSISPDLQYLTGYSSLLTERLTLFLVPQAGRPTMVMPHFESLKLAQEGQEVFYDVRAWSETEDPVAIVKEIVGANPATVGIAEQLWSVFLLRIQDTLPTSTRYISASEVLEPMRLRKDETEIANLREMGRRMDRVFAETCRLKFAGRTEREVGDDIFQIVRAQGLNPTRAGGVASGPNSASPHHHSGDRVIQAGDAIWIELGQGGNYRGYIADKTRVVYVGQPSEEFRRVYEVVKEAQETAYRSIRPGMACQEVDRIARQVITAAGYGQYFIHRVGHGLGLDVHEPPYMVEGNTQKIEPGMVFSVEPGIYLPDKFGIRIEDIVVVTQDGAESFYASTHDWVSVE